MINYSAIVGRGKVTLPSVDSGFGTMNILKDPPKMIMTRRINRVGDTPSITTMIDNSGDRIAESIQVYGRGINPFVAVSYSNQGTNGGQSVNGIASNGGTNQQASLPYRIGSNFRPPIVPAQSLLPLSRQPRVLFSQKATPAFADFTKRMSCPQPAEKTKEVRNQILKPYQPPTRVISLEVPITEPYEVKYVIQNPIHVSAHSGLRTRENNDNRTKENTEYFTHDQLQVSARTGMKSYQKTEQYVQEPTKGTHIPLYPESNTNVSMNITMTPIDQLYDGNITMRSIQDVIHTDFVVNNKGHEKQDYTHVPMTLVRNLPEYTSHTNFNRNIEGERVEGVRKEQLLNRPNAVGITIPTGGGRTAVNSIIQRDKVLNPTILTRGLGRFEGKATMPSLRRQDEVKLDSERASMSKKIMDMQFGRVDHRNPYLN